MNLNNLHISICIVFIWYFIVTAIFFFKNSVFPSFLRFEFYNAEHFLDGSKDTVSTVYDLCRISAANPDPPPMTKMFNLSRNTVGCPFKSEWGEKQATN